MLLHVISVFILGVIHHGRGTDHTNVTLCPPPPDRTRWMADVQPVHIEWGYGKMSCNTVDTCFRVNITEEILMVPQIIPVVVQQGTKISFLVSSTMSIGFSMRLYQVEEEGFRECSFSKGRPLSVTYQTSLDVEEQHLKTGSNFFIAKTNDTLFQCRLGLRLNVTVKPNKCSSLQNDINCSNRGHCMTHLTESTFTCSCCPGSMGQYCQDVDYCYSQPCLNGGSCTNNGTSYSCTCSPGYTGRNCEIKVVNMCDLYPCQNGGNCTGDSQNYSCICLRGYAGKNCEEDINECASNPCGRHGLCQDMVDGYQCYCLPGLGGDHCQIDYNECISSPCKNHGKCVDKLNHWQCECGPGYRGDDCSLKVDLCEPNPCTANATCIDQGNSHVCLCEPGYTGSNCEINTNECESNPCHHGGTCEDLVNAYICHCLHPHYGRNCERSTHPDNLPTPADESYFHLPKFHSTHYHLHNLYIIMGTLGGALLIALLVLLGCYCRLYRTYELLDWRKLKYQRYKEEKFDISSVTCPRPSVDAIYEATTINYEDNTMNTPVPNSLKPKKV